MRRLLLLVGAIVFVDTMFFAALTPLLPHYADDLGLSKAHAGLLAGAYPAGCFVGAIPGGLAAARLGVKPAALIGLSVLIVTTIVFGLAHSEWLLDAARFAQGVSSSFTWTAGLSWLVQAAPTERRGELIGSAFAAAIGGALFGPVLGGIAALVGTAAAFGGVAVLAGAIAVFAALTPSPAPGEWQPLSDLFRAFGDRRVLTAGWFVVLPGLLFGTLSVLGPLRLSELGFGAVAIGATWLVAAGLEAIVSPVTGRISDRRGRGGPLRAALLASAAAAALLPWPDRKLVLAVVIVAAAVSFGIFWTPAMSMLADSAEARHLDYGFAFALTNMAWAPGQLGGSALGGAIAGLAGDAVPYLCLAVICLASLALLDPRRLQPSFEPA
jgi:MFS family permease